MVAVPTQGCSGRPLGPPLPCSARVTIPPMVRPRRPPVPKARVLKNRSLSSSHAPASTNSSTAFAATSLVDAGEQGDDVGFGGFQEVAAGDGGGEGGFENAHGGRDGRKIRPVGNARRAPISPEPGDHGENPGDLPGGWCGGPIRSASSHTDPRSGKHGGDFLRPVLGACAEATIIAGIEDAARHVDHVRRAAGGRGQRRRDRRPGRRARAPAAGRPGFFPAHPPRW